MERNDSFNSIVAIISYYYYHILQNVENKK